MSSRYVNREKYQVAKDAATTWHEKLIESKKINSEQLEKITNLEKEVLRWKNLSEQLPDPEDVRTNRHKMKKQLEQYKDKIANLERDKLLLEGKIQQLEESKKDLKERYNELKQDYRDSQKWNRNAYTSEK